MNFLPIQFRTKIKSNDYKKSEILDLIEDYLKKEKFNYVDRKPDKIIFHKASGWHSWNVRSKLVSGIVKVKETNGGFVIINGNWMVFLILIPFILIWILSKTKYSTIDQNDLSILFFFFLVLFGGNLITRFYAHLTFKNKIKKIIKN
mgnify:CR=1 FL=1|tara:strand:- start:635 stop:1075 length:441 start_codon:yes stop_codon:yes gene_type:complete